MRKRLWVKICGTTSLADAEIATEAGADALGFVFAPSSRQVSVKHVARIVARMPSEVEFYGVFVHPTLEQVVSAVTECGLSGVQLHATRDPLLGARLRSRFDETMGGKRIRLMRVLRFSGECEDKFDIQLAALQAQSVADPVLIDSHRSGREGGTGLTFNWAQASRSFLTAAPELHMVAAGGLSPANVAEAIAVLRPWGVDVVTGVEGAPGVKDPAKVRTFVERARAAAVLFQGRI